MENASQALQMAAWVLLFVLALSISIASFGQANTALKAIIDNTNNRTLYTYIESTNNTTRTVGIETVIPAMYRAYKENYRVAFKDKNGNAFSLYKDSTGQDVNYIDLEQEIWGSADKATEHLDSILSSGLYDKLKISTFTEEIGEYYIEDKVAWESTGEISDTAQVNKNKKRIITYTVAN